MQVLGKDANTLVFTKWYKDSGDQRYKSIGAKVFDLTYQLDTTIDGTNQTSYTVLRVI